MHAGAKLRSYAVHSFSANTPRPPSELSPLSPDPLPLSRSVLNCTSMGGGEGAAAAADCDAADLARVLAAVVLAAIEHFNHLVLALSGSKLCFLILVVLSSFLNCCISVSKYTHLAYSHHCAHTCTSVCPFAQSAKLNI